jgi:hypothetical protein
MTQYTYEINTTLEGRCSEIETMRVEVKTVEVLARGS